MGMELNEYSLTQVQCKLSSTDICGMMFTSKINVVLGYSDALTINVNGVIL